MAYCLDGAVYSFGRWCDARLAETDGEGRPVRTLAGILGDAPAPKPGKQGLAGRYRSPRELMAMGDGRRRGA